jgi:hypothetical protein
MGTDISEGPSPFKETLKPEVADVTKTHEKPYGLHCDLDSRLACFSLFSACQRLSDDFEDGKKERTCCLGSESSVEQISSRVMLDWRPRLREHNGLGVLNATSHRFTCLLLLN